MSIQFRKISDVSSGQGEGDTQRTGAQRTGAQRTGAQRTGAQRTGAQQGEAQQAAQGEALTPPAQQFRMVDLDTLQEILFCFLGSISEDAPEAPDPICVSAATLERLYRSPDPNLARALQRCLDRFLLDVCPDRGQWDVGKLPSSLLGVALGAYTALTPADENLFSSHPDPVGELGTALVRSLPPARSMPEQIAWAAVLHAPAQRLPRLPRLPQCRRRLLTRLLDRCPLAAACHVEHLAAPLTAAAARLLPGFEIHEPAPWSDEHDWLDALASLLPVEHGSPGVSLPADRYLRRTWLGLPPSRTWCRNLGVLLDALQARGGHRTFLLGFYEAFDWQNRRSNPEGLDRSSLSWPIMRQAEQLSRLEGDSEAVMRMNRMGNEYLLLFRALVDTVITEGHPPVEFRHLSGDLLESLMRLMAWSTEATPRDSGAMNVDFVGE